MKLSTDGMGSSSFLRRTIRELATELVLTPDDWMPVACALSFDHVALAQRERIGGVVSVLPEARWHAVQRALLHACGFADPGQL
ncbi:MAG: hypothetical protein R2729_24890 [Bryobacteraceae bacterium]